MAVEFLHELNVPFFKVGSGDTNNFPYLVKTAKKGESELPCVEKWLKYETESSASVFKSYNEINQILSCSEIYITLMIVMLVSSAAFEIFLIEYLFIIYIFKNPYLNYTES